MSTSIGPIEKVLDKVEKEDETDNKVSQKELNKKTMLSLQGVAEEEAGDTTNKSQSLPDAKNQTAAQEPPKNESLTQPQKNESLAEPAKNESLAEPSKNETTLVEPGKNETSLSEPAKNETLQTSDLGVNVTTLAAPEANATSAVEQPKSENSSLAEPKKNETAGEQKVLLSVNASAIIDEIQNEESKKELDSSAFDFTQQPEKNTSKLVESKNSTNATSLAPTPVANASELVADMPLVNAGIPAPEPATQSSISIQAPAPAPEPALQPPT